MQRNERKFLLEVGGRISNLLKGKIPDKIELSEYPDEVEKGFVEIVNQLIECSSEIHRFIIPLSQGILHDFIPERCNIFSSPFKELHAQLLHLTWQVERVAEGDYSQRVDFMGDFSAAFNSMVEKLAQREQELKEINEKLINSNQQLQEFTYVASHDLREPIRKIKLFGLLLEESLANKLKDDDIENLNFMIDGAERMNQMIEALITYSRISAKGVESEKIDLNEIIKQLKDVELSVKLEETKAKILMPEPLPEVVADPAQIRQLLQNLISNALKYQKKETIPEVTIKSQKQDNNMIRIDIQDNGIGIKNEQYKNVFVMFRRLHSKSEYEGTGIGLAVCKRIVERHGGEIGVDSIYGKGSNFWFTIPSQKVPENKQLCEIGTSAK